MPPPCTCDRAMTYLELINKVLVKLREPEVSSVGGNKYTKLIGQLVNEAKNTVEDAEYWQNMFATFTVTTSSGVSDYSLNESNTSERTTVFSVIENDDRHTLKRTTTRELIRLKQIETDNNRPAYWALIGFGSSGNLKIRLYPTPDGVRTYSVNLSNPEGELTNPGDEITCPAEPVWKMAYAYAIKERGEDQGQGYREALDEARRCISRYKVLNGHQNGGGGQWRVV